MDIDFESYGVGKAPTNAAGFDGPSNAVTALARMYVEADTDGNQVLKVYHGDPTAEGEKLRSPRLEKAFATKGLTNMTVQYKVKSSGGNSTATVLFMDAETNALLGSTGTPSNFKEWTDIEIAVDVQAGTTQVYVNGKPSGGQKTVPLADTARFALRLSGKVDIDGSWVMIDDFKVTTTDAKYVNGSASDSSVGPVNEADRKPETGTLLTVLNEDFETQALGAASELRMVGGFTSAAVSALARMYVEKDPDGNQILRAYHGNPTGEGETARTPRLDRALPLDPNLKTLTIDYDLKTSGGETKCPRVFLVHASENAPNYAIFAPDTTSKDWVHVKIRCDFEKNIGKVYVDGRLQKEVKIDLQGATSCRIRFNTTVATDGSWTAIDNVLVTTPDTNIGGVVGWDGKSVNYDKLAQVTQPTGMSDVIVKSHPRIYVRDWQKIRDLIETDENAAEWYKNIIAHADAQLTQEPVEYVLNVRGNINESSSEFKHNVIPLAAAYCLTEDVRYKDRLYRELENVGNWPDWGANAWLCTAHINLGYAVCYDWLYDAWTQEERANILGWFKAQGLREAVLAYEGYGSYAMKSGDNWNQVCNGSNIVAALAVYDEEPALADYILGKAATCLPSSLKEISADGAYAEPMTYWDYGVRHLIKAMAALDTSLEDGKSLPSMLDFKNVSGLDKTCDFPIYYNGTTGGFNYGDGVNIIVTSPTMFYCASKYNKPEYAWYFLDMRKNNPLVSKLDALDETLALLWYNPENVKAGALSLDKFYQSTEKYGSNGISMRSSFADTDALVMMMHAGDQTASHSALDAGGFVLDWAGKRWVYMYGRDPVPNIPGTVYSWSNYHGKTEKGGHYDYYHCRAEANNTIICNPKQDMPDMNYQYYAEVERYESGENKAYGIVNMTDTNAEYASAKRGVMLTGNRDVLVLQDEITAKKPSEYYWFVNCNAEITILEDGKSALWEMGEDKMLVRITQGPADAKFEIMPTEPLPTSPDPTVQPDIPGHKMFIHIENRQTLNLTVEFVPLAEGEGIPQAQPIVPLANWSVADSLPKITSQALDDVLALKVDNPNAFAKGKKTYVDTANLEIKPIVQNGRTLVPVRFISENIGATVGWDDATQTVSIKTKAKNISLQLGSNLMIVDGVAVTLDVPAQEIGGRTLIPLRALVEALGKQVFWDDRGLILITDAPVTYSAEKMDKIIDLLDIRVQSDGKEIKFFDSEVYNYNVEIAKGATVPNLSVLSAKEAVVSQGNPATVTIDGKVYTFSFVENAFEGVLGTGSEGVAKSLSVTVRNAGNLPTYQTYLDILSATSSVAWNEKYPMTGTYDGIINDYTQNRWSANGIGNWICYDLGEVKNLHSVAIAGYKALSRNYKFDIEVSADGVNYTKVCSEAPTQLGADRNVFKLGDVQARYVRITGVYAYNTTWIGIAEVRFYDSLQMETDDQGAWGHYFYTSSINAMTGGKLQLEVEGKSKSGNTVEVNIADVIFTSENPEIASVDANGVVTLNKVGTTTLRAEYTSLGVKTSSSISVNVEPGI